jgi:arsenite methyltransferase
MHPTTTPAIPPAAAEAPCCGPDCCTPAATSGAASFSRVPIPTTKTVAPTPLTDAERIRATVRQGYGTIAREGAWTKEPAADDAGCCGGGCCGPTTLSAEDVARAVGYADGELASLPDGANMGLSCGNPTAIAALKPGEIVLDLGAGGGFDCFIAGPKVGAAGKVIGVDMTADMVTKARGNLPAYRAQSGLDNVEFRLGEIESLPVADASVDVVISNCVLNLSPDKPRVWKEIARVLKPGGRVAVSDLALLQPLPESVRGDLEALVGCVAGAVLVDETRRMMVSAGLTEVVLASKPQYVEAMTDWHDPLYQRIVAALPQGSKASDYVTSLDIAGRKPR